MNHSKRHFTAQERALVEKLHVKEVKTRLTALDAEPETNVVVFDSLTGLKPVKAAQAFGRTKRRKP